jgi:ethanolamine utilization protein EutA
LDKLLSIGLDIGTTTTQLIVSELTVENKGNAFSVPEMVIGERKLLYQSPVTFTPLISGELVDGEKIAAWVEERYQKAGITKDQVDTGAVIITGETSRKENARQVLHHLSGFAGDFVVATAGPDLESMLSAKGAGATDYSAKTGKTVLHMDIGGGTSNLSYIENGQITATGCLNVGGRLVKLDGGGKVTYISPVLTGLCDLGLGEIPTQTQLKQVAGTLVQALQMAAGLTPATELLDKLTTKENAGEWIPRKAEVLSFSGGVADCIETEHTPFAFGDLGVLLGRAIRESDLCKGQYRLGEQTIRATVIGAGCHSAQLSGSTVFYDGVSLPKKNLPVANLSLPLTAEKVANAYTRFDRSTVVLSLSGYPSPSYEQVQELAKVLVAGSKDRELLICLEQDCAKALGHSIRLLAPQKPCLCIDRIRLENESFLDIGMPVGPALPVVVKTLVLSQS